MKDYFTKVPHTNTMHKQWMSEHFKPDLVSVIMPAYNRADLIKEALDSVRAQCYRPIELIIIDDGSTDNTHKVIKDWRQRYGADDDFHLQYYRQKNAGAPAARNRGLIESHGEYIQFLDSDDRLHPERIERVIRVFKESSCDFIQTGFDGFCLQCGETIEQHYGNNSEDQLNLALKGRLWANTLRSTFRRSLTVQTGAWDEEMTCFEDYDYVLRALLHSSKSLAIRDILASARRGGSERISERLKTREGRETRIRCEERFCVGVRGRDDISIEAKQALASRLYALGFRSKASGWPDLGQKCGELADSISVELDSLGKRRRIVWRLGKWAGIVYEYAGMLKEFSLGRKQQWQIKHNCTNDT